ncbi:MAG: CPBP family intramembrane metalloprotease [Verrucomicrobiae bacterium]|nr:CPBP family intramembrane metalloprotease [Verrucomicrobiae bacterium]
MGFPTPFLDCLILAATAYPSGFGHSLHHTFGGRPGSVTTAYLGVLLLPYVAVAFAIVWMRPGLIAFAPASAGWLAMAVLAAPVALGMELGIHGLRAYRATGRFPRFELPPIWRVRFRPTDRLLVGAIVVGEEVFYRQVWLGVAMASLGWAMPVALAAGSVAYGLNHLAFGGWTVVSKSLCGAVYGLLFLAAGGSLWPAIVAHGLQNVLLFRLAGGRHA